MLLGIVSDTHANVEAIQAVTGHFQAARVDLVLHLGDDYLDSLFFEAANLQVVAVPGLYCPEYRDPAIPNRRLETLAGVNILMVHAREAARYAAADDVHPAADFSQVDIVLYGHTHIPGIQEHQGILWVNPGHLKANDRRGHPLSYALMHLAPPDVNVKILALASQKVLAAATFTLSRKKEPGPLE